MRLARVMLLPPSERASDYHVAFGRTKLQCRMKWSDMKHRNPALLASVVAEATAEESEGSSSSFAARPRCGPVVSALSRALSALTPRQRLLYSLRAQRARSAWVDAKMTAPNSNRGLYWLLERCSVCCDRGAAVQTSRWL